MPKTTHGLSKHPLRLVRNSMIQRCTNLNDPGYDDYGGRGIAVCDTWLNSLEEFYNWAIANGYKKRLQLDRKDNNGDYCPENCRFVPL